MSGYSTYADDSRASAPPPFDASIYDGSWAPFSEQNDLAGYPQWYATPPYFYAPPESTGEANPYEWHPSAHVAADQDQDVYPSSVDMYGKPAAASLADGEAWCSERCLPSPGANTVAFSTRAWSSPDLTTSVDGTSRSTTPASTSSSSWDSYDGLPVAGSGAFPAAITANRADELHSADAPISLNPEIPAVAAEPEAPTTRPRPRLSRKREQKVRKADDSRWLVSGPEEERQISSKNVKAFNDGHLIWDANAPDLATVKAAELEKLDKAQRRTAKSASTHRANSTGRGRRTQSRSHPEPAAAPAATPVSRAQTPAPARGRRACRAPPPPAPVTPQDAPGPESISAPLYRPRAYSSAPMRVPAPHVASRAPARSQSSAPVLAHALVYKSFDGTTIPVAGDHGGWSTDAELRTPSDVADVPSEPWDLERALAGIQAGNGYIHEDLAAIEHFPRHDQLPVAGSSLGLHFDSAYGAPSSSGSLHHPTSSGHYPPPAYPPPRRSSPSPSNTLSARTHGPQPGQPNYWDTPLPSMTAPYDPYAPLTPHAPYESYYATSSEDAPVRSRKRRVPDDGFLDHGTRTYHYIASR